MSGQSLMVRAAERFGMEPAKFEQTLMATIIPNGKASREQVAALLIVAEQYDLSVWTKELYAFPAKGGGIVPIVGIDGWISLVNRQATFDGVQFEDIERDGKLYAVKCCIYRKDLSHPVEVTEYLSECRRNTDPWNNMTHRMLRHRSYIQCARIAFGLSGIYDPDEGAAIVEAQSREIVTRKSAETLDALTARLEEQSAKIVNGPTQTITVEAVSVEPDPNEPPEVSFADLADKGGAAGAAEDAPWG